MFWPNSVFCVQEWLSGPRDVRFGLTQLDISWPGLSFLLFGWLVSWSGVKLADLLVGWWVNQSVLYCSLFGV